jgi:hypothetical protein
MAYRSHLTVPSAKGAKSKGGKPQGKSGRVVHVIMSLSDPKCKDASQLYGVYYRIPKVGANEDSTEGLSFAYQGNVSMRTLPMEGEMVTIVSAPAAGGGSNPGKSTEYWTGIVPVWNHPHHNAAPDTKQTEWEDSLLGGVSEQSTVNPIQANPGDMVIEGRLSQSIRIGGFKGTQSTNIDESNNGKPIILISNGQIKTDEGSTPIEEDINKDYNSLYFLSDHKSDLIAINKKRDSYDIQPLKSDQYIGNQVLLNGGRLFFNAKEDSAFISAKESIGLNARTLNFDAKDYFCVDAKKIYLGKAARTANTKEPVVLGNQLENWLNTLLDTLESIAIAMSSASAVTGGAVTQLNAAGPELLAVSKSLKTQVRLFQSRKVFTE